MTNVTLTLGYEGEAFAAQANQLSQLLAIPIDNTHYPRLMITAEKLVLLMRQFKPLYVDFNSPKCSQRRAAGKQQGLIRACQPKPGTTILDTTAGWGRDAALLASFGAKVLMLERSPVMASLLYDGLKRFYRNEELAGALTEFGVSFPSSHGLSLLHAEAKDYLETLSQPWDVIYIDPMHPMREKSALVKKEMQALQALLGPDLDAEELLAIALTKASHRVVVKWPQNHAPLKKPTYSLEGKTIRFDIYLPAK